MLIMFNEGFPICMKVKGWPQGFYKEGNELCYEFEYYGQMKGTLRQNHIFLNVGPILCEDSDS